MPITCEMCGFDANPDGATYCEACGSEISVETTTPPKPIIDNNTPPPPKPPIIDPIRPINPVIMGMAKLVAKQPDYPKSEFQLSPSQPIIVGRFDDTTGPVDIDLAGFPDDDTISRNHAEIYFEGNEWKVKPISTTNGTFIRKFGESRFGGKITTPEVINNGDEIAFAKLCFIFQVS